MKLVVISHTEHYKSENNEILGFGPTVREINHLGQSFEKIYHVAPLHKKLPPNSALPYNSRNIYYVPLKPTGGRRFIDKLSIIYLAPYNLYKIFKAISKADVIHFRAPTSMGIFVLPLISLHKKPKWIKYAGNWVQENPPLSSLFQRWWLKNNFQNSKVTINGSWDNLPNHILSFENPCLTEIELECANKEASEKEYSKKINICFVGRIEKEKGASILLDAIMLLTSLDNLNAVYFVGEGNLKEHLEKKAAEFSSKNIFTGILSRDRLNEIYTKCHIFCLPSDSEGFPKALAEAAAYGCVPIVSDISAIGQYIDESNGYLVKADAQSIAEILENVLKERSQLIEKAIEVVKLSRKFTYQRYIHRILHEVIK